MTLQTDLAAFRATLVSFLNDKVKTTQLLTTLGGGLIGALPPSTQKNAVITGYNAVVAQFDVVTKDSNALNTALTQLTADAGSSPPATTTTVSPNGAAALAPSGKLTDHLGDIWGFGSLTIGSSDYPLTKNGTPFQGAAAELLTIKDGVVWGVDSANNWWTTDSTGKWVTAAANPFVPNQPQIRSPNTRDGGTVGFSAPNSGGFLVDMNAAHWSNGAFAPDGKNFVITRNGIPFAEAGFTATPYAGTMIRLKNGIVWIKNAAGSWVYPPV